MQGLRPEAVEPGREAARHLRRHGRDLGHAPQQGLKIETCAPHQQRHAAAGRDLARDGGRHGGPAPGADLLPGGEKAIEVVRAGRAFLRRGLGRDEGKIRIDLARVRVDDLAAQLAREMERQGGLAGTCGTGQADDGAGRGIRAGSGRGGGHAHAPAPGAMPLKPPCGAPRQGVPGRTMPASYLPSSARRTFSGTSPLTSAPWLAADLMMVELM